MREWLLVGIGGGLGAMARHGVNALVRRVSIVSEFPAGLFAINVLGSGAIGLVAGLLVSSRLTWTTDTRTFVIVGLLGGFTTFSSFSLDTLTLVRSGQVGYAAINVLGQVVASLVAVGVGYRLGGGDI